jgi:hypothetical protein
VSVMVESSQRPVFFADGDRSRFFLRTGNATRELDAAEAVRHVTGPMTPPRGASDHVGRGRTTRR